MYKVHIPIKMTSYPKVMTLNYTIISISINQNGQEEYIYEQVILEMKFANSKKTRTKMTDLCI